MKSVFLLTLATAVAFASITAADNSSTTHHCQCGQIGKLDGASTFASCDGGKKDGYPFQLNMDNPYNIYCVVSNNHPDTFIKYCKEPHYHVGGSGQIYDGFCDKVQ
ncbi:hypothetical protein H4219_004362 [Mycoemilia scoparia]|uniref:Uncharacterized protein n=1 Tax=Mycoemilia scoparia TaxID=417184 RepID=A0A9W7ZRW8_9FUNG|nr:hypothetical protein H4219_004362 [Mycoemilia scoparia]